MKTKTDTSFSKAIAYFELSKTVDSKDKLYHEALIKAAIRDAYALRGEHQGKATFEGFAVEIMVRKAAGKQKTHSHDSRWSNCSS